MNLYCRSLLTVSAMLTASFVTYADSLRCNGKIVDAGVSEQELLATCGEPTAREGADWLYEMEGSAPLVVTIGNGVVMFIRGLDESDAGFGTHPLGDPP